MTRGADRFKEFRVVVEYNDGTVNQWDVDKHLWFKHVYKALESDETVVHYTVEKLYD